MIEFTCAVCGAKGLSNTKGKKFCSKKCSNHYYQKKRYAGTSCKFNDGVGCYVHKCGNCGWNPAVTKKRSEAL